MLKRLSTLALTLALATPLASARASSVSYNVCGGTFTSFTYAFCASVQVSVNPSTLTSGAYTVAMTVVNSSGQTSASDGDAIFQMIGLDNISNTLASPVNVQVWQNGSQVCSNLNNDNTGGANCWGVKLGQGTAGGLNIDFLDNTNPANQYALSSCFANPANIPPNSLAACAGHAVTISFDLASNFDPSTADVYIKAQNGPNGQSTECVTGPRTSNELCTNITTTPEPATMGLMATGLFGLVPVFRRRRNGEPIEG